MGLSLDFLIYPRKHKSLLAQDVIMRQKALFNCDETDLI
jgi:hypothetical protein